MNTSYTYNITKTETTKDFIFESLNKIEKYDPEFYQVLFGLIKYLESTTQDKYSKSLIDTRSFLYHEDIGFGANILNASKYIGRYATKGFSKSYNPEDLKKAIHYLLFELTRRIKEDNLKALEKQKLPF